MSTSHMILEMEKHSHFSQNIQINSQLANKTKRLNEGYKIFVVQESLKSYNKYVKKLIINQSSSILRLSRR